MFPVALKSILLLLLWMHTKSELSCPHGYYPFQNTCYGPHFDKDKFNYDDASKNCDSVNSTLVTNLTKDSIVFLRRLYWKMSRNDYWVGIVDGPDGLQYESDHLKVDSVLRDKGQYKISTTSTSTRKRKCVSFIYTGSLEWKKLDCPHEVQYICEFTVSIGKRQYKCSRTVGDKCYVLFHNYLNHSKAKEFCNSGGGKLAEIRSLDEFQIIEQEILSDSTWERMTDLELNKISTDFPEIWLKADEADKFMCRTLKNWTDIGTDCDSFHPFICEIIGPSSATTRAPITFSSEDHYAITSSLIHTNGTSTTETLVSTTQIAASKIIGKLNNLNDISIRNATIALQNTDVPMEIAAAVQTKSVPEQKLDYTLIVIVPVISCFVIALIVIVLVVWLFRRGPGNNRNSRRNSDQRQVEDSDGYLIALEIQKKAGTEMKEIKYQSIYGHDVDDSFYETID